MTELLKNGIFKSFLSAILFAVVYSLISFIDKGNVEVKTVLISTISYFIVMCLLYFIASKFKGSSKNNS